VADDHLVVLQGLVATLGADYLVVGQVSQLAQLPAAIAEARPQVVVVDIVFDGQSVLPTLATLTANRKLATHYVVLTGHASGALAQASFDAGATGFVLKGAGYQELRLAIDAALQGRRYSSGGRRTVPVGRSGDGWSLGGIPVSAQQVRILCCLLELGSRPKVADRLHLSIRGVDHHVDSLRHRLGLGSLALLIRWASDNEQELRSIAELLPGRHDRKPPEAEG
jgi:DNA-binding NarL/FixJ family response regulator